MVAVELAATDRLNQFFRLMEVADMLYRANPKNPVRRMDISSNDVLQLFKSLNAHQVRYLLVGGWACVVHGHIRTTQDLDLWIEATPDNKDRLIRALQENDVAGAEYLKDVPLLFGWTEITVGLSGLRLDTGHALKAFSETDFSDCYDRAMPLSFHGVMIQVLDLTDLITEKQATGRPKDLFDVEELQKLR